MSKDSSLKEGSNLSQKLQVYSSSVSFSCCYGGGVGLFYGWD